MFNIAKLIESIVFSDVFVGGLWVLAGLCLLLTAMLDGYDDSKYPLRCFQDVEEDLKDE